MINQAVLPPEMMRSVYGPEPPRERAAHVQGISSLEVSKLFPDIPKAIYLNEGDLTIIRKATEEALARVDMSRIRHHHTVNILCSEHGFSLMGGGPYAEMIRTVKDVVQERTGCKNIRLRIGVGAGFREANEITDYYQFDHYFNGQIGRVGPFDQGVPIETEIGTLYGVAKAYDADWFIHTHYGDLRELYVHRLIDKALKPFAMSYARLETRGVCHFNFGPRSSSFVQRAIFNSPFIQGKYAFTSFLMVSPAGVVGIDADNDLNQVNRREMVTYLKSFGKLVRLLAEIRDCVVVLDGARCPMYAHMGGIVFGNFVYNPAVDYFDLDSIPAGTYFAVLERPPGAPKIKGINTCIKALVINHMWTGMFCTEYPINFPTIVVGRALADVLLKDPRNPNFMNYAVTSENLETAVQFARRIARTDNVLVFDGSFGSINLSPSLAEFMLKKAPEVSRRVDEDYFPKWLRQRGIDPQSV